MRSGSDDESGSEPEESGSDDESGSEPEETDRLILTDPSILRCPICCRSLLSPVYQCLNGHIACAPCCLEMFNKCGCCRGRRALEEVIKSVSVECSNKLYGCKEIFNRNKKCDRLNHEKCLNGHIACAQCCLEMFNECGCCRGRIRIRCRALEGVIKSVSVECRNKLHGCKEIFNRNKKCDKLNHEKVCSHSPCMCPDDDCIYFGSAKSLYKHFSETHSSSTFSFNTVKSISLDVNGDLVFLQDRNQGTLFILKRTINDLGSFVGVTCVGPDSMGRDFSYDLTAVICRDKYVIIKAGVVCVQKWSGESALTECLVLLTDLDFQNALIRDGLILINKD